MRIVLRLVLTCSVLAVGCGGGNSGIAPTTVIPTKETFTGTLPPLGLRSHTFSVSRSGTVEISLTAAGPPDNISIGLGVGTPTSDAGCSLLEAVAAAAAPTAQIIGTATPGTLCVAVFDPSPGVLTGDVDYTVIVSHP
jgi:hypothetical protein